MKYLIVVVALMSHFSLVAQIDGLELTKQYLQAEEYKLAYETIKKFNSDNESEWSLWLLGDAAHRSKHYCESKKAYEKVLIKLPDNDGVRMDYANKLVERKLLHAAKKVLAAVVNEESVYHENQLLLAKIHFWEMNYQQSAQVLKGYLKLYPQSQEAKWLMSDVNHKRRNQLAVDAAFIQDNQPINTLGTSFAYQKHVKDWLRPTVEVSNKNIDSDSLGINATKVEVGTSSILTPANIYLDAKVGYLMTPSNQELITGKAHISKSFYSRVKLSLDYNRDRYLYTLGSINNLVYFSNYSSSIVYNHKWFELNVNGSYKEYNDDNVCLSQAGWLLLHIINNKWLKLNLGYAYSRSESDFNSYGSVESLPELLAFYDDPNYEMDTHPEVVGDYLTYYTPDKQEIHSGLINLNVSPIRQLSIGATASYGFEAKENVPYLFIDADANGNSIITKEYSSTAFTPKSLDGSVAWQINRGTALKLSYKYFEPNFYYNSSTVKATLLLSF